MTIWWILKAIYLVTPQRGVFKIRVCTCYVNKPLYRVLLHIFMVTCNLCVHNIFGSVIIYIVGTNHCYLAPVQSPGDLWLHCKGDGHLWTHFVCWMGFPRYIWFLNIWRSFSILMLSWSKFFNFMIPTKAVIVQSAFLLI